MRFNQIDAPHGNIENPACEQPAPDFEQASLSHSRKAEMPHQIAQKGNKPPASNSERKDCGDGRNTKSEKLHGRGNVRHQFPFKARA